MTTLIKRFVSEEFTPEAFEHFFKLEVDGKPATLAKTVEDILFRVMNSDEVIEEGLSDAEYMSKLSESGYVGEFSLVEES